MRRLALLLLLALSCLPIHAQDVTPDMKSLANDLYNSLNKGNQKEAESLADRYLALCTSDDLRYGPFYAEAKHVKARAAAANGDYALAERIMDEVIAARLDKRSVHNDDRVGTSYFDRSTYRFRGQNIDGAIADLQAAADAYKQAKENAKYATALCQMAVYCKYRGAPGDAEREEECYETAFPYVDKSTPEYLSVAARMINAYNELGKTSKASKLAKQLQKSAKKISEKNPIRYADFLLSASVAEANDGDHAQALAYTNEAIEIYKGANRITEHNYAVLLKNAADCHFQLQHYNEALALYEKAKPLLLQTEGNGGKVYQGCDLQLNATRAIVGTDIEKVRDFLQDLENQICNAKDTTTINFANSLLELAKGESTLGNYKKAASWAKRALQVYEARGDSLLQANTHYTLSNYYKHLNQIDSAEIHNNLARQLSHIQHSSQTEANALNQQALLLYNKKQYNQADSVFQQALLQLRESNLSTSTVYASILCNRALCQSALNAPKNAISLTREALDLQTSILGPEHGDNVMLLYNLAMYYHRTKEMDSVAYYYHRAITLQTRQVRNDFSFQSTRQREQFWQGKSFLYQTAPLFATSPDKAPSELLSDIYNAQLFTKGILLNSEIDFRRLLQQSADKKVLSQYDELQALRAELQQCYEAKAGEGKNRIPELQRRIEKLEYAIIRQCKAYGDFTQNLSLTADSVLRAMLPGEAAVEFLEADITYGGKPDRLFLALILRPEWKAPRACRLFYRSDMEELGYPAGVSVSELLSKPEWQNKIYSDSKLGKLVWDNLIKEIPNVTHIYFAPTGVFYQWGIEYMPITEEGKSISETLYISRLSSTKLLAQRNDTQKSLGDGNAVIYGGLEYEKMTVEDMYAYHNIEDDEVEDDENFTLALETEQLMADSLALADLAERGAKVKNLSGAKEEAEAIERLLYNSGKDYKIYEGFSGTEESFKRLNGRNISLLHIATHGFSYPVEEQKSSKLDWLNSSTSSKEMPTDPLCYSGLLFSGCNNKLQNPKDFPADIDDGILTAQEIAQLNLQNLQLTVLSACQTGTGTLRDDGVFGVQRGFKKAGAHTLVMSLWSVSDAATQLMMTSFYEGLLSGQSRHEAFLNAQAKVREAYPQPHFWAPFIMLDDI